MRKLIIVNIMSLDGYYEGPGRNVMALTMDEAFDAYNLERIRAADTVLLGHTSYEMFSGFWPSIADKSDASPTNREFSRLYNNIEKVAVSNHLTLDDNAPWRDTTRVIGSDTVYEEVAKLKRKPAKDVIVLGSRVMWNDLLAHGLIDELHFIVGNVVLGDGTPMFVKPIMRDDPKRALELIEARKFEGSENMLVKYKIEYKSGGLGGIV